MRAVAAQSRMEILLTLRRGESLLVMVGIPVFVLIFFTVVDVLPHGGGRAVDFLVPGVLALSVIASAMTSLSIATGFERQAGVLKLLGTTPLGRGGLLAAKVSSLVLVVVLQVAVTSLIGLGLAWRPGISPLPAVGVVLLGTVAFASLGFTLAGTLRAETNLAVANALFLLFVFLGGVIVPIASLPTSLGRLAGLLPAEPFSSALRASVTGAALEVGDLVTLVAWAGAATLAASRWFRFDP